jgi:GT2 family glycosyltransferase
LDSVYTNVEVSIVIINYNTFALTCGCINSIVKMTSGLKYEIIVVDNNSTEFPASDFKRKFQDIILIESPVNVGFAKGNNLGIARASGKYILLLNSDTVLLNDAVSRAKNFLECEQDVGVLAARLEYPDGRIQHNCQRFPSIRYKLFELLRLQKFLREFDGGKILFGPFFGYDSVAYPDWVWGTFFMFRRESLKLLPENKLADDFFMYVEDVQWCMDFKLIGYRIAFLPTARVIHLMGGSGSERNELMIKNMNQFMERYSWVKRTVIQLLDYLLQPKI